MLQRSAEPSRFIQAAQSADIDARAINGKKRIDALITEVGGCTHPMRAVASLATLEDLRRHVRHTLCAHDSLDPDQTPLLQGLIVCRGKPCGLFFQTEGPRLLKTYAVWAGQENRILFYDSAGLRFGETTLSEAPDPQNLAA
jgi:hypothetical protein